MKRFFSSIATIITIALAVLLLATVINAYMDPYHLHIFAFLGFGFSAIWILNVLSLVFWLVKFKKQIIIPLVVIIIAWPHWQKTFQWSGTTLENEEFSGKPLTVMSFNVKMFDYYNWSGKKDLHEDIFNFIRESNPDVVCLQEFFSYHKSKKFSENHIIARLHQYPYRHIEYGHQPSEGRNFGLATFSKYPINGKRKLKFEKTTNFSIQTDILVDETLFRVFNNHLESIRFNRSQLNFMDSLNHLNDAERRKGIKEITWKMLKAYKHRAKQAQNISRHIKNSPSPVIVCGDFNDTPVSYVYRTMRGNLKDAFVESGKGFGGTYNGQLPSFRIDFIFHDPTFKSYNFSRKKVDLSDHFPIITAIDLSLPPEQ